MLRIIEVQFLHTIIRCHGGMLAEEIVELLIEYFHGVIQMSPIVTRQMRLADTLAQLVS